MMDENTDLPDEERGLYAKYRVIKVERDWQMNAPLAFGESYDIAIEAHEVTDPLFVMKFDDPAAQDALWVYANSVKKKYPKLAADIKEQIYAAVERAQTFLGEMDIIEEQGRIAAGDSGPSLRELVTRPDAVERYLEGVREEAARANVEMAKDELLNGDGT
jgi:hypothetical protein